MLPILDRIGTGLEVVALGVENAVWKATHPEMWDGNMQKVYSEPNENEDSVIDGTMFKNIGLDALTKDANDMGPLMDLKAAIERVKAAEVITDEMVKEVEELASKVTINLSDYIKDPVSEKHDAATSQGTVEKNGEAKASHKSQSPAAAEKANHGKKGKKGSVVDAQAEIKEADITPEPEPVDSKGEKSKKSSMEIEDAVSVVEVGQKLFEVIEGKG